MTGLTRWLPRLTTGLGIVHLVYGVAESPGVIADMLGEGLIAASDDYRRDFVTWFFIGGLTLLTVGSMMRWAIRQTGRVPAHLGWWLTGVGVLDTLLEPDGGGWALLAIGLLTLYAARPLTAKATSEKALAG
ncbi:DUF6463 family protein [Kribbella sp. NBC_01245]|uniref:DUF6463 family protein n=1 Tax=Kribbella sp. NBC_01245 TaxID=2903578 RepID=UPI002E2E6DDF|nr:DUF6463 family protein [Kribbella sp. NBC_01245]